MQLEFFPSKEYQLLREIGRGGMASVYEAIETAISRRVAIKILPPSAGLNERQIERFRTEANIAAALDHPHIVPVYSVGREHDTHFYTMKYIEGHSLAEWIDGMRRANDVPSSRETFRKVANWGIQAAEALDYAHSKNVIHGDIKPSNLLVDIDGSLSLADFGVASCKVAPHSNIKTNLAGTLRYMSPEQIDDGGTAIDHRSDLYSLGATLFELVTMKPYIDGDRATDILTRIAYAAPSHANRVNPSMPTVLDAIVYRATARDPQARCATAREMADDLRQFLIGQQTTTLVASQSKRSNQVIRRVRVGLAASVVAAIVGIGSLSYMAVQTSVAKVDLEIDLQSELANSYYRLGVSHGQQFDHAMQEKMLQQSIELWEKLALRHGTPRFRFNALFAWLTMAELYYDTGRIQEAKEKGGEAIAQFSSLHQSKPEDSLYTFGLACAHARVGAMLAHVLTVTDAEQHQRTGLAILATLDGEQADWTATPFFPFMDFRGALAECRLNLAAAAVSVENLTLLTSALTDLNDLSVQESAGAQGQAMLARAKWQYGEELERLGRHAEAERQLSECVGHFKQLTADHPEMVSYRFGFATAVYAFGGALRSSGKASEAMAQFNCAIELLMQLESDFPRVAEIQHYLAGCLNNYGIGLSIGDYFEQYEEALRHELIAVGINPEHRQYRRWVVKQHDSLVTKYEGLQDRKKMERHLIFSIVALQHLIQIGIATYEDRHDLGHRWLALGLRLSGGDRFDDAAFAFCVAKDQFTEMVDQFGRKPHDICMRAKTLKSWSELREKQGKMDQSQLYLEQAIDDEAEAFRLEPFKHRETLSDYQSQLEQMIGNKVVRYLPL